MEIIYKDEKAFTKENIIELFLSVDWQLSASNPDKLYTALIIPQRYLLHGRTIN